MTTDMEDQDQQNLEVDLVRHPPHYTHGGVEVIEFTRHCSFNIGNALKYLARHEHKGTPKQDLEKALWYLNDHIKHFGPRYDMPQTAQDRLRKFVWAMDEGKYWYDVDIILLDLSGGFVNLAARALKKHIDVYYS